MASLCLHDYRLASEQLLLGYFVAQLTLNECTCYS